MVESIDGKSGIEFVNPKTLGSRVNVVFTSGKDVHPLLQPSPQEQDSSQQGNKTEKVVES